MIDRFLPGLVALGSYDRSWFRYDLVAGVSVAAVAVPIAIAYAQLAGVPPVYGLYASLLPLLAYALLGSSRQLIMAPDAATCAIVAAIVAPLAGPDPERYVSLSGARDDHRRPLHRGGPRAARLPHELSVAADPDRLSQRHRDLHHRRPARQAVRVPGRAGGILSPRSRTSSRSWQTHAPTLALGLATFALLRVLTASRHACRRRSSPWLLGIAARRRLRLGDHGVALLGAIPAGLPPLTIPVSGRRLAPLALGALGLALISYNSAMVTARGFARQESLRHRFEPGVHRARRGRRRRGDSCGASRSVAPTRARP